MVQQLISGNANITAGIFDDVEAPYRANSNGEGSNNGPVMVLPIDGPMMRNDYCGSLGTTSMGRLIEAANNDASIQSIVLSINSPGGTVDGTESLANKIKASQKPIVTHARHDG